MPTAIERAGRRAQRLGEPHVIDPDAIVSRIGDLAQAGEKMIERLRKRAFPLESRKGHFSF